MATYRCKACQAVYVDPQLDGTSYFHSCAPVHNPAYDAQFTIDASGNAVPRRPLDPRIPDMQERPDKRDENVEMKPDGKLAPKVTGKGRDTL